MEPGKQEGGTNPSSWTNPVLLGQLSGVKHQLQRKGSIVMPLQRAAPHSVVCSLQNKEWEKHHCLDQHWVFFYFLWVLFFFFFLPPQEQMQSAKSHQKACITSGKLSLLTLWASPQGRTTGGRLQGKIGLLKWQFIVNHFSKLLIEALSVREEGDLSFCPSRTLMTP